MSYNFEKDPLKLFKTYNVWINNTKVQVRTLNKNSAESMAIDKLEELGQKPIGDYDVRITLVK